MVEKEQLAVKKKGYRELSYKIDSSSNARLKTFFRGLNFSEKIELSSGARPVFNRLMKDNSINDLVDSLSESEVLELLRLPENLWLEFLIYRYKYNTYPEKNLLDDYPPCVQVELTSVCNLRCTMCYQADSSFSRKSQGFMGHMDFGLFESVIDELRGNVHALTFASRGEPTLYRDFERAVRYVGDDFLGFKLNTNATLLDEAKCHVLLDSGLRTLVFSVDSADKLQYEQIRVNGKFDEIQRNISQFFEIKERYYPSSKLVTKVSGVKLNESQSLEAMDSTFGRLVDFVAFVNYSPWENSYTNDLTFISEPCSDLWRRIFIWWDGQVNPCDYDYKSKIFTEKLKVGDSGSVRDIWRSSQYARLRQHHIESKRDLIEPCMRCNHV